MYRRARQGIGRTVHRYHSEDFVIHGYSAVMRTLLDAAFLRFAMRRELKAPMHCVYDTFMRSAYELRKEEGQQSNLHRLGTASEPR